MEGPEDGARAGPSENPGVPTPKEKDQKMLLYKRPKDVLYKNAAKGDKPFKRVTLGVPFPMELNVTALRTCSFWFPDFAESKASITN